MFSLDIFVEVPAFVLLIIKRKSKENKLKLTVKEEF